MSTALSLPPEIEKALMNGSQAKAAAYLSQLSDLSLPSDEEEGCNVQTLSLIGIGKQPAPPLITYLIHSLSFAKHLQSLTLSNFLLEDINFFLIMEALFEGFDNKLEELDLSHNKLTDSSLKKLILLIKRSPKLAKLNLSHNTFTFLEDEHLYNFLGSLSKIKTVGKIVDLRGNRFASETLGLLRNATKPNLTIYLEEEGSSEQTSGLSIPSNTSPLPLENQIKEEPVKGKRIHRTQRYKPERYKPEEKAEIRSYIKSLFAESEPSKWFTQKELANHASSKFNANHAQCRPIKLDVSTLRRHVQDDHELWDEYQKRTS
ncbi:MAG: hypothetical protein IBJ00_07975 [Alphaproteobacteria bacterium]|nr:hypothetical protein [Alphaproteobacteria bacterium]